ncbi:hypothetical protein ACCS63_34665, partial [Rhizobium brockwellii]
MLMLGAVAPAHADAQRPAGYPRSYDALVAEALAHNNDVGVAEASLRQAREQARATRGSLLFPQGGLNYNVQRTRVSNALSPAVADQNQQLYTLHTAQVSVSYDVDAFGGNRA